MRLPILAGIAALLLIVALTTQADNSINGVPASDPLHVSMTTTGTMALSGTTETPTFVTYTTGTTAIAAGAKSLQFIPSLTATGSLIYSGTFPIDGAVDSVIPLPVRPGDTIVSGTIILTSGTVRSIPMR